MKYHFFFLLTLFFKLPVSHAQTWATYPASLNPADEIFVKNYINLYRNGLVNLQKDKSVPIHFIEYVLISQGIPKELKNLAVTESYLNKSVVSGAGAAGPWQFMPQTAIGYGLRVDTALDERFDVYKSTYAAAKILKELYRHFGDWNLVVAAYSCGPGAVDKAITKAGSRTFWDVEPYLPLETRNHVKKFISTTHVLDNKTISPWQPADKAMPDSAHLAKAGFALCYVPAGYRLQEVAAKLLLPNEKVAEWNPLFNKQISERGYFWLILPVGRMPDFLLYRNEILASSIRQSMLEDSK